MYSIENIDLFSCSSSDCSGDILCMNLLISDHAEKEGSDQPPAQDREGPETQVKALQIRDRQQRYASSELNRVMAEPRSTKPSDGRASLDQDVYIVCRIISCVCTCVC